VNLGSWLGSHLKKKIADTLISDTTYFKMNKPRVLVFLKAWTGDIEPFDILEEAWVQISGVPPKWCNWRSFRQISSTLGDMVEVDWNSLFANFFGMVRIKKPTRMFLRSLRKECLR
jgi:hypothetical protein